MRWDYIQALNISQLKDISSTNYDWGIYNAIGNGGNIPGIFRLLTKDEWTYLIAGRWNAQQLCGTIKVYDHNGNSTSYFYLLPDNYPYNYQIPTTLYATDSISEPFQASYPSINTLTYYGVVLFRIDDTRYWTSSYSKTETVNNITDKQHVAFLGSSVTATAARSYRYYSKYNVDNTNEIVKMRIRLVKDIK